MCNPALVVTAVSAAVQAQQQKTASRRANKFNEAQAARVRDSANRAAESRYKAVAARSKEARELAQKETEGVTSQALKAAGVARLTGAGASVGAVLSDLASQKANIVAGVARRSEFSELQSELENEATREQARGRIFGAIRPRVGGGEFLGAAIKIAGSVAADQDLNLFGSETT